MHSNVLPPPLFFFSTTLQGKAVSDHYRDRTLSICLLHISFLPGGDWKKSWKLASSQWSSVVLEDVRFEIEVKNYTEEPNPSTIKGLKGEISSALAFQNIFCLNFKIQVSVNNNNIVQIYVKSL